MFVKSVIVCIYMYDCKWLQIKYEDWKKKKKKKKKKTLQETISIHDSTNLPKIEFIAYIYILI